MNHWYTQDQLGSQRRADLDREADREAIRSLARATIKPARTISVETRRGLLTALVIELRTRIRVARRVESAPSTHR